MIKCLKFKVVYFLIVFIMTISFSTSTYCIWLISDVFNGLAWINEDLTFPVNEWYLIDDNNDGIGYYYYFDEHGMLMVDTIAPDYRIVNKFGQRLLLNGEIEAVAITSKEEIEQINETQQEENELYNIAQKNNSATSLVSSGILDNGLVDLSKIEETKPAPQVQNNGQSNVILGKNVVIVEKSEYFDPSMDPDVRQYLDKSNSFSKKVNGTIFNKSKWKEVMALKGNDSYADFKNPSNNFNRIRGRVATHYFTYTDRTTVCTINVYADGEEIDTISGFDYNSGVSFDILLTNVIRLELVVDGQYTSRVVYLKDVRFGFNKKAYKEELEEEEAGFYFEEETTLEEETEEETEEEKEETEIPEEKKTGFAEDKTSGPAFDKALNATSSNVGPLGVDKRFIPGKE